MDRLAIRSIVRIVYRLRKGQSERAITRDLRRRRATIRHHHEMAEEKGHLETDSPVPAQ